MFDLNDLRYFLCVARVGSLSRAARQLGVTHATVGRRIHALERSLDARLFERTVYGYALTLAGKEILVSAEAIDEQAWSITQTIAGDEDRVNGLIRLTTSSGLGNCWLANKLPALEWKYPDIQLEIAIDTGLVDLLRREADIALRVGHPGSEELVGKSLGKVSCGLYASVDYLDLFGEPLSVDELGRHQIVESIGGIAQLPQSRALRECINPSNVSLSVDSLMSLLSAAQAGLGIVPLPSYMTGDTPGLKRILPTAFDIRLDLWLLTHQDLRYTARIRAVRDFLIDSVRSDSLLLSGLS